MTITASAHPTGTLFLVELNAHARNGHWADSLLQLAEAASGRFKTAVIVSRVSPDWLRVELDRLQVDTHIPKLKSFADVVLFLCICLIRWLGAAGRRCTPASRFIQDLRLFGTALHEALLLRSTTSRVPHQAIDLRFLLSGGGPFVGLVQRLSDAPHVRVVHDPEMPTTAIGRYINDFWRKEHGKVLALCPTAAVERELRNGGFFGTTNVQPFAMRDPRQYIGEEERRVARQYFNVSTGETVICLVGGWWAGKDIETVARALTLITSRLHIVIAGYPVDETLLQEMLKVSPSRFTVWNRGLGSEELRRVYAAADASIVSRQRAVGKESGLVMDAVKFGVPLILSECDDGLREQIRQFSWVAFFRSRDAGDLARTLDLIAANPLPRPPKGAAENLGLRTPNEILKDLWTWALGRPIDIGDEVVRYP